MNLEPLAHTHAVLVVDDDELSTHIVSNALEKAGYAVIVAQDGVTAVKIAVEQRPAIILVDLRMPEIDGHTFMRRARAHGVDAAFIVMSGSRDPEDIIDAIRNGATDYLSKPFSLTDLITALGRAVESLEKGRSSSSSGIGSSDGYPPSVNGARAGAATRTPPAPALGASDPVFSTILRRVQNGEILIPSVPAMVLELQRLLGDPDTTLDQVTAVIERDQRVAAQLLRVSNTVPYARGAQNGSLRTAVGRIGLRQIQSLVRTIFARASCEVRDAELAPLQTSIWRFSVARAVSMRALAEGHRPPVDPELAYLAGLFCDVGASFLLWVVSERNCTQGQTQHIGPDACQSVIAQNHEVLGSAVLSRWSVESTITMLARIHHAKVMGSPANPYALLECVALPLAERLAEGRDVTGDRRDASLIEACTRRYKPASLDALFERVSPTYQAIVNTLG